MNNKFFEFLHTHNIYDEEVYKYFLNHSDNFDYYNEDFYRCYIGCNYIKDRNDILKEIRPCVPRRVDDITTMINIHEYVHTLCAYSRLNRKFKLDDNCEILPIFYEKLFILECNNPQLNAYENVLDSAALGSSDIRYIKATKISNELLDSYEYDEFKLVSKNMNKLNRKYY